MFLSKAHVGGVLIPEFVPLPCLHYLIHSNAHADFGPDISSTYSDLNIPAQTHVAFEPDF